MPRATGIRFIARRLAWAVGVLWLVLTVAWVILTVLPESRMIGFAEVEMGFALTYETTPGPFTLYVDWMRTFLTLQWGQFAYYEQPIIDVYLQRLPITLAYVVPGVVVSVLVGTGLTTYAAVKPKSPLNRALSVVSYLGLSLPAFVLATFFYINMPDALGWTLIYDEALGLWHPRNLFRLAVPAGIVALNFFVVQVRHAQSETTEYLGVEFVKTVRAKGAGQRRIAIHIFRNVWPALASLVVGEALGLLLLTTIVIERVLNIPGVAIAVFNGFGAGNPMMIFTAVFGIVLLGISGTLVRDFTRFLFDPRIDQ